MNGRPLFQASGMMSLAGDHWGKTDQKYESHQMLFEDENQLDLLLVCQVLSVFPTPVDSLVIHKMFPGVRERLIAKRGITDSVAKTVATIVCCSACALCQVSHPFP